MAKLLGLNQYYPYSVSDGSGGSISASLVLVHPDMSSSLVYDILNIQRSDSKGSPVWRRNRCFPANWVMKLLIYNVLRMINGGIFLTWQIEKRDVAAVSFMFQRVDAAGNILFGDLGQNVFGTPDKYKGMIVFLAINSGGIFVVAPNTMVLSGGIGFAYNISAPVVIGFGEQHTVRTNERADMEPHAKGYF